MSRRPLPQGLRYVPLSYRFYRGAILLIFLLILLFVWVGTNGHGPIKSLHKPTETATTWVKKQMGVTPTTTPMPTPAPTPAVKSHAKKHHHHKKRK